MSKKFNFGPTFNAALLLLKDETGYSIWEESGRMRVNKTDCNYSFYESLDEFFEALDKICDAIWEKRQMSYYSVALLRKVIKDEKDNQSS